MWIDSERLHKIRHETHAVQRKLASASFELWQKVGFHVVADHFYDPVPNTKVIRKRYTDQPRHLPGLSIDWSSFEHPGCEVMSAYLADYLADRETTGYREENYYFNGLDALYYYAFVRDRRPRRIIEIGQGFSTRVALSALAHNARLSGEVSELVSVDPFNRLRDRVPVEQVRFSVIPKPLQEVADDLPAILSPGDLLFVDSSHVFKFDSDVQSLFEHVYPQLAAGVWVHIHDIFTPFDYPLFWLVDRKQFWNEQYFLETFLSFNDAFRVDMPLHHLSRCRRVRTLLEERGCGPQTIQAEGASIYLQKVQGR